MKRGKAKALQMAHDVGRRVIFDHQSQLKPPWNLLIITNSKRQRIRCYLVCG